MPQDTPPKVLVTGGAGYIGSHACKALARAGYVPVTFDSFVTGRTVNTVLAVVGVHCIPGHAVFIIQKIRFKGADRVTGSGGIDVNDACSEQNKSGAILDSRHTVVPTDILDKVLSLWIPEAICKRVVSVDCGFDGACCAVIAVSESLQTNVINLSPSFQSVKKRA